MTGIAGVDIAVGSSVERNNSGVVVGLLKSDE